MIKVSAFYLEEQKRFIPKKKYFLSHCQYQNKKALFTDPIFSEGFGPRLEESFSLGSELRIKSLTKTFYWTSFSGKKEKIPDKSVSMLYLSLPSVRGIKNSDFLVE